MRLQNVGGNIGHFKMRASWFDLSVLGGKKTGSVTVAVICPKKEPDLKISPVKPRDMYAEWNGYPDWVGTNYQVASGVWRSFEEARRFVS